LSVKKFGLPAKQTGRDGFELSISLDKAPYSAHDNSASQTTYLAVYSVDYEENGTRESSGVMFSNYTLAKRFADLLNSLGQ
jgi:hypothetical protein